MAWKGATIEIVESSVKHPNADKLSVVNLVGKTFQVVSLLDQYKAGDKVVFIEIDSIMPEKIHEVFTVKDKLAGKNKDRVKTKQIRQVMSQGVIGPISILNDVSYDKLTSEQLNEVLGITKYEPPEVSVSFGNQGKVKCYTLPGFLSKYDIESIASNKNILDLLIDQNVCIQEKTEGQNFSISYDLTEQKHYICSRSQSIVAEEPDRNIWWSNATRHNLFEFSKKLAEKFNGTATIYAEQVGPGIQGNIYKLKEHSLFIFDFKIAGKWMNPNEFNALIEEFKDVNKANVVPNIAFNVKLRDWINGRDLADIAYGKSAINPDVLREGIVIRPMVEQHIWNFGRLIMKLRDRTYLAQNEN